MRLLPYIFSVAVLAAPQLANAAIVYDSVNINPAAFNSGNENVNVSWDWIDPTANGPTASQFTVPYTQTLNFVSLELSADTPGDGASIMVYLLPDVAGQPPFTSVADPSSTYGTLSTFVGGTLIGTIPDSSLTQDASLVTLVTGITLAPGSYWIGLATNLSAGETDPLSGLYGSGQWWWSQPDPSVPVTLNFNSIGSTSAFGVGGTNPYGAYELIVSTPEPATVALLGGAMAGLGFMRRRRNARRS